jgi:hypothetical protein
MRVVLCVIRGLASERVALSSSSASRLSRADAVFSNGQDQ